MDTLTIGETSVGPDSKPKIIAEIGTNYRDDLELAKAMIDSAGESGADVVKFQTHLAGEEMVEDEMEDLGMGDLYSRIQTYELSVSEQTDFKERAEQLGLDFLSTPFSVEAVDILEEVGVQGYKIGSGELTNYQLLDRVAETGKPLLISTGMADWSTIEEAVSFINSRTYQFALLYCVSEYPINPQDFNLGIISRMKEAFDVPVGFSDHSQGTEAATIAMARGADFVEKHFTIDRRLPGGDQDVSVEPEELSELSRYADLIHETQGEGREVRDAEVSIKEWAQHSVVTAERIEEGTKFTQNNITTKRPGIGISAKDYFDIIGSTATTTLLPNTILTEDDISR